MLNRLKSFAAAAALLAAALTPMAPTVAQADVVVSSKLSSESAMIGHMIRLLLDANGIKTVDRMTLGGTPVVRKAIIAGEIDIYIEYTGNAGFFFNKAADPAWKDLKQGYALGSKLDYDANKIVWLTPANANNTWAIAVRKDVATANHLKTMVDFGKWITDGGKVVLTCSAEFVNSAAALPSMEKTYNFTMKPEQLITLAGGDTSTTIKAAADQTNGTNAAMVYGTDGGIAASDLVVMDDIKNDQPVYAPVPIIREVVLKANPKIADLVKPLMESFDRESLQALNARIQVNGEPAASVAEDYLKTKGFLK